MPRYLPKTQKGLDNYLRKKMATYYTDPWVQWNQTTSASTNLSTWNIWVDNGTASTSPSIVWNTWNQTGGTAITNNLTIWDNWVTPQPVYTGYQPRQLTPEEQAERDARMERLRTQEEERRQLAAEAKARAKALLLDHLDPAQKADYEEKGEFKVEVGSRSFVIGRGTHGNVREVHLKDGQEVIVRSFCIPAGNGTIPEPDVHLAQKLMLEGGDDSVCDFHRIANITEHRPSLVPRLDRELQAA